MVNDGSANRSGSRNQNITDFWKLIKPLILVEKFSRNEGIWSTSEGADFIERYISLLCSLFFENAFAHGDRTKLSQLTLFPSWSCLILITAWEQRKLGDCFDFLQNNTLSRADLNPESGSARNIHYGDILIKFGDCLGLGSDKLPFVDDESILSKYANSTLRVGDIIFADTAEDESAGKCVELVELPNEPVISGLHTIPVRPKFPFGSGYLGHYLNAPAYHDQLLPLMQGIKVISVSKTALQDTQICFPSVSEQFAIGASFNALDSLITLHQREPGFTDMGYMRVERALMTMSMSLFSSS